MKGSEVVMAFLDYPSGKAERRQAEQDPALTRRERWLSRDDIATYGTQKE